MNRFTIRMAGWMCLAMMITFGLSAPSASAQGLGVAGGINYEQLGDIDTGSADANFDNSTGYHFGVVYDATFGPLAVRPGFFYRKVGTYEFESLGVEGGSSSYDVTAFEVPLDFRYRIGAAPLIKPYIMGGPMLTIPRGEDDFDEALNDSAISANIGAGLEVTLPGAGLRIVPELRYQFGVSDVFGDEFEVDGRTIDIEDDPQFSAFSVRLHVMF